MSLEHIKICANKKGVESIKALCDVALRHGGISNLQGIVDILNSLRLMECSSNCESRTDKCSNEIGCKEEGRVD